MSSDDTRGRILDAAGEVFADRGFNAATIREICRQANVNVASVNYYFGDKEHLYIEAFKAAHPGGTETNTQKEWPDDVLPAEQLRIFIHQLLERLFQGNAPSWKMRLIQREFLEPTRFCKEAMQAFFQTKFAQLMSVLDEILPPEMPSYRRHQVGFSIIGQCVHFRAAAPIIRMVIGEQEQTEYHTVELLSRHVSEFVLAGLGLARPIGKTTDGGNSLHMSGHDQSSEKIAHPGHKRPDETE